MKKRKDEALLVALVVGWSALVVGILLAVAWIYTNIDFNLRTIFSFINMTQLLTAIIVIYTLGSALAIIDKKGYGLITVVIAFGLTIIAGIEWISKPSSAFSNYQAGLCVAVFILAITSVGCLKSENTERQSKDNPD